MANTPDCDVDEVGIKVEGDLGEISIEDIGDEDDSDDYEATMVITDRRILTSMPKDLLKPTAPPAYSSVSVSHSENVQFGNNTFFNGPVTIKQIIQNGEQDNPGYEHTEDESVSPSSPQQEEDDTKCVWDVEFLEFRWWIKMAIIAFCVVVIGGIFGVIVVIIYNATQDTNDKFTIFKDEDINCDLVEGVCLNMNVVKLLIIVLGFFLFIGLWYVLYTLAYRNILTRNCCHGCHAHEKIPNYLAVKKERKLFTLYNPTKDDDLLIAANHLRIVTRTNWLAGPVEKPLTPLRLPAPWVIITHTDTESCVVQSECVLRVRLIQMFHVESRQWNDIGYNYLVGGDGSAYYGRGWDYEGAHTLGYNKYSIGIAFIGTFNTKPPPKQQIEACQKLIKQGVELGKIAKDYKLFGHRQLASTLSPGDKLFEIIKEWPHFVNNDTDINTLVPDY